MGNVNDLLSGTYSVAVTDTTTDLDAVVTGPCKIFGIFVTSNNSDVDAIVIWDAILANPGGGNALTVGNMRARASAGNSTSIMFGPAGVQFSTGLSVQMNGLVTGPTSAFVIYRET